MSKIKNPPAFPLERRHFGHSGMSLRDYFAARALAGMLPHPETVLAFKENVRSADRSLARTAYRMADAMLAERDREGGQ